MSQIADMAVRAPGLPLHRRLHLIFRSVISLRRRLRGPGLHLSVGRAPSRGVICAVVYRNRFDSAISCMQLAFFHSEMHPAATRLRGCLRQPPGYANLTVWSLFAFLIWKRNAGLWVFSLGGSPARAGPLAR